MGTLEGTASDAPDSEPDGRERPQRRPESRAAKPPAPRRGERELLEVLLAEPGLVPAAARRFRPEKIEHPGLRQSARGAVPLCRPKGEPPDLDHLRPRIDNARAGWRRPWSCRTWAGRTRIGRPGCEACSRQFRERRELPPETGTSKPAARRRATTRRPSRCCGSCKNRTT